MTPLVERTRARSQFVALGGALELLQSPLLLTRVGGVYALEALACETPDARECVTEVLSGLVRRRAPGARAQSGARVPGDVQAALAVLGRAERAPGAPPLDLHGISLREAFLPAAQLAGAWLYDCDLQGALLQDADLRGAWLWRANLERVNLDGADLRGADLSGARGLKSAQVERAQRDAQTRLPALDAAPNARWAPR